MISDWTEARSASRNPITRHIVSMLERDVLELVNQQTQTFESRTLQRGICGGLHDRRYSNAMEMCFSGVNA